MPQPKWQLSDLAVTGAPPAFARPLHVGRPNIGSRRRLHELLDEALDRRWLSNNGPLAQEFEARIADLAGTRHCVATCNATLALQVAARALDLGGEVIVPSFTFVATAHALEWTGAVPVFCDIDPRSATLDAGEASRLITDRTSGILGVHLWGHPCPVTELADLARQAGVRLFYDAAHALGCSARGRAVGGFGEAEIFSFHATKFVNSFEGGAVVTDSDDLAARLRALRNFGYDDQDDVAGPGTNAKMSEASAAMGLVSLEALPSLIETNRRNYSHYRDGLAGVPGVLLRDEGGCESHNFQYVVAEVDEEEAGLSRDMLMTVLRAENVLARSYFSPGCHRYAPYRDRPEVHAPLPLPRTETLARRTLVLPTGTAAGPADIAMVCGLIRLAVAHGPALRQRLVRDLSEFRAGRPKLPSWTLT